MASFPAPAPAIPAARPKRHVILNDILRQLSPRGCSSNIHLFNGLPSEIRLKIWTSALQRYRILTVAVSNLGGPDTSPPTPHYSSTNRLGRIISGRKYFIEISLATDLASSSGCAVRREMLPLLSTGCISQPSTGPSTVATAVFQPGVRYLAYGGFWGGPDRNSRRYVT